MGHVLPPEETLLGAVGTLLRFQNGAGAGHLGVTVGPEQSSAERLGLCRPVSCKKEACLLSLKEGWGQSASSLGRSLSTSAMGILMSVPPGCCADRGQTRRGRRIFVADMAPLKREPWHQIDTPAFKPFSASSLSGDPGQVACSFLALVFLSL